MIVVIGIITANSSSAAPIVCWMIDLM